MDLFHGGASASRLSAARGAMRGIGQAPQRPPGGRGALREAAISFPLGFRCGLAVVRQHQRTGRAWRAGKRTAVKQDEVKALWFRAGQD